MTGNEQKVLDFFRDYKIKADARLHEQRDMIHGLRCECDLLEKQVEQQSDYDYEVERNNNLQFLNDHITRDNARLRRENLGIWTAGIA